MSVTFESGFNTTLGQSLKSTGSDTTITLAAVPTTVTSGVLRFGSGNNVEWMSFTGVSSLTVTGVTRGLDKDATSVTDATASNKKNFSVGTPVKLVAHSLDLNFKANLDTDNAHTAGKTTYTSTTESQVGAQRVTETQRDALTGVVNGDKIYNTTSNQTEWYEGGAWVANTGGSVPDSSTTVAGKVETGTSAETIAGTDTGGTSANLFALPSDIAKNVQSSTFIYGVDGEASDTYVVALTPTLTAYTAGQFLSFKANTANTGACSVNFDTLGALPIKKNHDQDPEDGDIEANSIVIGSYDGTNFQLHTPSANTMSTANSDTLTDGSNADALHSHQGSGQLDKQTTAYTDTPITETTMYTYTIPGGTMGANDRVVLKWSGTYNNGSGNVEFKTKFNGVTYGTISEVNPGNHVMQGLFTVINTGSASAQTILHEATYGVSANFKIDREVNTATIDTTGDIAISVTVNWSTASGSTNSWTPFTVDIIKDV